MRVRSWEGRPPTTGDQLRTRKGQRYLVLEAEGKKLECVMLAADAAGPEPGCAEWIWEWERRRRRRKGEG